MRNAFSHRSYRAKSKHPLSLFSTPIATGIISARSIPPAESRPDICLTINTS